MTPQARCEAYNAVLKRLADEGGHDVVVESEPEYFRVLELVEAGAVVPVEPGSAKFRLTLRGWGYHDGGGFVVYGGTVWPPESPSRTVADPGIGMVR